MFSLICARTNGWVNNREVGDLRRHRAHYGVIVMPYKIICVIYTHPCHNFKGGLANSWWTDMINYHYGDVIMGTTTSQITSLTIVYSAVFSGADQRKHQSSASLAFVRGIHRWPVNSPHKWPVTGKCFHLNTSSGSIYQPQITHCLRHRLPLKDTQTLKYFCLKQLFEGYLNIF